MKEHEKATNLLLLFPNTPVINYVASKIYGFLGWKDYFSFFGRQILQVLFNKLGNSNAAAHVFSAGHCKKVIIIIKIKVVMWPQIVMMLMPINL